jgi:hypothetical protein
MSGTGGILAGYESLRAGQKAFYKDLQQAGLPGCACGVSWLARWRYPTGRSASLFRPGARRRALPWSMPSWAPRAALDAVAATDPILPLRMAAIYERLGQHVGSDQLIKIALDAVLAGIDSPALVQLAGLSRKEEPEAHELFALACDELGLTPTLPPDPGAACWELIRWLSELIVAGDLPPEDGVWLIEQSWLDAWQSSDYPAILRPLIGAAIQWDEWAEEWDTPRETYRQEIIDGARQILKRPWPPDPG